MSPRQKIEYSKITPYILIGTNMCCGVHYEKLIKLGIETDISLEETVLECPRKIKTFLWLPTRDHTAPSQLQLQIGVATIRALVKNKKKCYVHCKNGHGRAPTLVAAYFISRGMSVNEAINLIKKHRPEIHIEKPQVAALKTFEN